MKVRGALADEFIQVIKNIWTSDQPEFHGKFFSLPRLVINAKPVQKPHLPIYIAAFAPAALKRDATMANGWNPTGFRLQAWRTCSALSGRWPKPRVAIRRS